MQCTSDDGIQRQPLSIVLLLFLQKQNLKRVQPVYPGSIRTESKLGNQYFSHILNLALLMLRISLTPKSHVYKNV